MRNYLLSAREEQLRKSPPERHQQELVAMAAVYASVVLRQGFLLRLSALSLRPLRFIDHLYRRVYREPRSIAERYQLFLSNR